VSGHEVPEIMASLEGVKLGAFRDFVPINPARDLGFGLGHGDFGDYAKTGDFE
jgi:hypothetical protein